MIEIVFVITIIAILISVGIRKFILSKDDAKATTVARDVITMRDAIMTHYYTKDTALNSISDVVQYNTNIWTKKTDISLAFQVNNNECITLEIIKSNNGNERIKINVDESLSGTCEKIRDIGIADYEFTLRE
jgi:type II secretory pathway pseudopilin PulG